MKNKILIIEGLLLILFAASLSLSGILFVLPYALGAIYLLLSLVKLTRIKILFSHSFILLFLIQLFVFDEMLAGGGNYWGSEIRTFWFSSGSGVCVDGTFCSIWGQFILIPLIGIIGLFFFIMGVIKTVRYSRN